MKTKRIVFYILWMFSVILLYFFESSGVTGCIVLLSFVPCLCLPVLKLIEKAHRSGREDGRLQDRSYADERYESDPSVTCGIREYIPGDSIRSIHWKLSEKTGKTMVREYGQSEPEQREDKPDDEAKDDKKELLFNKLENVAVSIIWIGLFTFSLLALMDIADSIADGAMAVIVGILLMALTRLIRVDDGKKMAAASGLMLIALTGIFAYTPARNGAIIFVSNIMKKSAALNRYSYVYPEINVTFLSNEACLTVFSVLLCVFTAAALEGIRLTCERKDKRLPEQAVAFVLLIILTFIQCYYGILINAVLLVPAYLFIALQIFVSELLYKKTGRTENGSRGILKILMTAGVMVVIIILMKTVFSGAFTVFDEKVEIVSEQIRDILEPVDEPETDELTAEEENDEYSVNKKHAYSYTENEEVVSDDTERYTEDVRYENMISMPEFIRKNGFIKSLLMFAGMIAVIIVPFIPFAICEKKKRELNRRRELFDSEDARVAVCEIFPYLMECIGMMYELKETVYSEMIAELSDKDTKKAEKLNHACDIWQEAMFSEHDIKGEQKDVLKILLTDTEKELEELRRRKH